MWLISKYGFASAVEHRDEPGCVLVRAGDRGDLEEHCGVARDSGLPRFSEEAIEENPNADYRYRMTIRNEDSAELVTALGRRNRPSAVGFASVHPLWHQLTQQLHWWAVRVLKSQGFEGPQLVKFKRGSFQSRKI